MHLLHVTSPLLLQLSPFPSSHLILPTSSFPFSLPPACSYDARGASFRMYQKRIFDFLFFVFQLFSDFSDLRFLISILRLFDFSENIFIFSMFLYFIFPDVLIFEFSAFSSFSKFYDFRIF